MAERIGLDCAPLAGVSDSPFRLVTRLVGGPDLVFSEMISATGLLRSDPRTNRLLIADQRERPLVIQLFGPDPHEVARAAALVQDLGADAIDLNLACPVRKVVHTGSGLALLRDPERAAKLFELTRRAADRVPLSAKLRAGWGAGEFQALEIGRLAEQHGLDRVILHARRRTGYDKPADWSLIAELKAALRIEVTGNGDVRSGADAARLAAQTGCDRVMIGRAALGDPWLFKRARAALDGLPEPSPPALAERGAVLLWHLDLALEHGGPWALTSFRKHLGWYCRGIERATEFRRLAMRAEQVEVVRELVHTFFPGSDDPAVLRGLLR